MGFDAILVLLILVAAVALFATERLPIDTVALMVLGALVVFRLITPEQAVSGLSNQATVTVAAMFVLSAGLQKTGALEALGRTLIRLGAFRSLLLVVIMALAGGLSVIINNTPVVAVMLPLILAVGVRHKISASRLLIPLSFASQFGGVCSLIGTSTNLLVSAISDEAGYGAFSMFEFARLGLILFGAGVVYFLVFGRFLLPDRRGEQLTEAYQLGDYMMELRVTSDSDLIGTTLAKSKAAKDHDVRILRLRRDGKWLARPRSEVLQEGDVLLVEGEIKDLMTMKDGAKLEIDPDFKLRDETLKAEDTVLVEALVAPRSRLAGLTLAGVDFHRRYNVVVLAVQRRGERLLKELDRVRLQFGDALLLQGSEEEIGRLRRNKDFIILEEREGLQFLRSKAPLAIGIISGVVALATFAGTPIMVTAIIGALIMVLSGCLSMEEAYEAIDWKVIFLLAGVLPMGVAMTESGAAGFVADTALGFVRELGPVAALATIYLLTALLTEAMSNNAAAILLSPIAISTALGFGVSPKPFLMAVTFAASTSFATPVGYQTNAMIYNPGGYRYADFIRVGVPLNLIFWILAVTFIPRIWPF